MVNDVHLRQIRTLTISLFISGALNVLLIAFTFFWAFRERPPTPYCELKPKAENTRSYAFSPTNADLIKNYKALSYEQLFSKLMKTGLVEDGFTERDLALAVLAAFHDFDLEKALGKFSLPLQKRMLSFNEGQEKIIIYSGLTNDQFDSILTYIHTEKWPFKSKGLYHLLKKEQYKEDQTLLDAFMLTQEYALTEKLFKNFPIKKEDVLFLLQEGDWGLLSAFIEKQKTSPDFGDENRQRFLLGYLKAGSKTAAKILLKTDFEFVSKRLSDPTVISIARLIEENTPEASQFLASLAASPRGDQVRAIVTDKYEELTGKKWEPLVSRTTTLGSAATIEKAIPIKEAPKSPMKPVAKVTQPPKKKDVLYIVQDGDSLWKIAKLFKVSINEIRSVNKLKTDFLKPGTPLKIPPKTTAKGLDHVPPGAKGNTSKAA